MSDVILKPLPISYHGSLNGLGDDDHTQYHNDTRALAWLVTRTSDDLPEGATNLYFTVVERNKLSNIESFATADQTDVEIETAYNNRVPVVEQVDAEAGTSTMVVRWTPERVKQAIDALASGGGASLTLDTKKNIVQSTPTAGSIAYSTDTKRFYIADGTNWNESATTYSLRTSTPDMGASQSSSLIGYNDTGVTDKVLSNCRVGTNALSEEGAIGYSNGVLQIFLDGQLQDVVTNFRFREDANGSFELEHRPVGFDKWIEIISGNSDVKGLNGLPLIQNYCADMGVNPSNLTLSGGRF